jgi:holo-[acyl-carrier protein] synthase
MILGIGVDLVDVNRIEAIIYRWQQRFLKRVFTDVEIRYCNNKKNPAQRFATRFAAKEAFIKALFPKNQEGICYRDIEIDQKDNRPAVNLYGTVKEAATQMGVKRTHVMLSHDGNYSIANVILEGDA